MTTHASFNAARKFPRYWKTIESDALTMPRFEFIAQYVARMTQRADDRALVADYRVALVDGGWVYGFNRMGAECSPCDPAKLYDMIRRTPLGYLTQQADSYRVDVHMAKRQPLAA